MPDPTTQISTTDIWQTVATILFALSLISERISNLLKLWFTNAENAIGTLKQQKKHELNVMYFALFSGILTSFIAGADFFHLINYRGQLLGFSKLFADTPAPANSNIPDEPEGQHIMGTILTGLFVSLGSKFWHDILDIVLQFSNLKKYQATQALQGTQKTNASTQTDILNKLQTILPWLKGLPGFSGYQADPSSSAVNIMFDKNSPISDQDKSTLTNLLGNGTFNIVISNIRQA